MIRRSKASTRYDTNYRAGRMGRYMLVIIKRARENMPSRSLIGGEKNLLFPRPNH